MRLPAATAFWFALSGCGEVLSLDDYEPVARDASPPDAVTLPLLPAQPDDVDDRRARCTRCVEDRCDAERAICLGSERCREMLRCMGPDQASDGCSDPACIARCLTEHEHSPYFHSYFTCAFGNGVFWTPTEPKCASECGPSWDCIGAFDWDAPPREPAIIHAVNAVLQRSAEPYQTFPRVEAAACTDGFPTDDPRGTLGCASWLDLDVYGEVEIAFGTGTAVAFRSTGPSVLDFGAPHRAYPWPAARAGPIWIPLIAGDWLRALTGPLAQEAGLGRIVANQYDCIGTARASDIDVTGAMPWTPPPHPEGTPLETHLVGLGAHDPNERTFDNALFINVPAAQGIQVTSSLDDGALRVSARTVLVAADWTTDVALYPMSRAEAGRR